MHLGSLATKIKPPRREEITIPNAVFVSNATTNYSGWAKTEGVFVRPRSRLATTRRATGARVSSCSPLNGRGASATPSRLCCQTAFAVFYVQYTLLSVSNNRPARSGPRRAARQHPRRLQRIRRADHVPELQADPSGPQVVPRISGSPRLPPRPERLKPEGAAICVCPADPRRPSLLTRMPTDIRQPDPCVEWATT